MLPAIAWKNGALVMVDQRRLPWKEEYLTLKTVEEVARAIEDMVIRGAPAIGIAAAYGLALGILNLGPGDNAERAFDKFYRRLWRTRPTARNLFWALERMKRVYEENKDLKLVELKRVLLAEARAIEKEDLEINRKIGENGASLVPEGATILTHCNAGALATAGYGTALGVIRSAFARRKKIRVLACETRPFLQGARLTVWELAKDKIPVTLITDNMAGWLMQRGEIGLVIVGADRIARNGDTANKIGTYSLAVLAREHRIPFYVAAPLSTFDFSLNSGQDIPIEERKAEEVRRIGSQLITLPEVPVKNPAFDVTPGRLISAIITEKGVIRPPFTREIARMRKERH
ncbi:MAG: Methylthioribose-1-phosphate isomerase [Candidatus Saccharicenans subterraneus]|uniref:Methylthioribose-1-phosphate isomerase n=1 Tax=Candidatus Saccharicenans subterraneus TaxID=2508984 RepID=A0A3E2BQT1_9BACT|nr:MAG: Methylthioribose-1-phosphate isomerase [Candidatus Saccharicenans subterraneum]